MPSREFILPLFLGWLAVAVVPLVAQVQRAIPATATLPESNEAAILTGGVQEALQAGDMRLAIRRIEQIMDLGGELVAGADGRTYQPVWRHARRLFSQIGPAGVEIYRTIYDAEVAARFREARDRVELDTLRELFRRYPLASSAAEIGRELAGLLLDRGAYAESLEILREMERSGFPAQPTDRAMRIVALTKIGAWSAAQREAEALQRETADGDASAERLRQVRTWMQRQRTSAGPGDENHPLEPMLQTWRRWEEPLSDGSGSMIEEDESIAAAVTRKRRLPLIRPLVVDDLLIVRSRGVIWALDELTLAVRWRVPEGTGVAVTNSGGTASRVRIRMLGAAGGLQIIDGDISDDADVSSDLRELLYAHQRCAISEGFQRVFTVEPGVLGPLDFSRMQRIGEMAPWRNELVARDLATGSVTWRIGADPTAELYGAAFLDVPVVVGGNLAVAVQFQNELRICVLDPRNGRLLRMATVVGQPLYLPPDGGVCRLVADETTIYVSTGNGVVAAFGSDTLQWKWATLYPSNIGARFRETWRVGPEPKEFPSEPPVLSADLLILSPPDSGERIALDRFSGQERWRVSRADEPFLFGACESGVLIAGNHVVAVDDADGATIRWRSVPLEITGRGAVRGDRLYVPTREGVVTLDTRNGRVVADQWTGRDVQRETKAPYSANIAISGSAVFCVSPNVAVRFPDADATERLAGELLARGGAAGRAHLARAWLRMLQRDYQSALSEIEQIQAEDTLSPARDKLLGAVFVALSRTSESREERLNWLRQANSLTRSPETAARLAILIGDALEEGRNWPEALSHYRELLLREPVLTMVRSDESGLLVSTDSHAAERIRAVLSGMEAGLVREFLDALLAEAERLSPADLYKVIGVMPPGAARRAAERKLLQRNIKPELALPLLSATLDPAMEDAERRSALLDRWEIHTALGMLDEARADATAWKMLVSETTTAPASGESSESTSGGADEITRRVERIGRSMRKLELNIESPFTEELRRRWKIDNAEILFDPLEPMTMSGPWFLMRDNEQMQIALVAARSGERRLPTPELIAGAASAVSRSAEAEDIRLLWQQPFDGAFSETSRVAFVHEQKAAVVVPGGVVCVGLGPERRGGQRLWDRVISEWPTPPANIESRLRVCTEGVVVTPRPGRIQLLRWQDGKPAWQRDVTGGSIRQLEVSGGRLLCVTDDGRLHAMRIDNGADEIRSALELGTISAISAVNGRLIAWTDSARMGLDARTLAVTWSVPNEGFETQKRVHGVALLAYQPRSGRPWRVIDPVDGRSLYPEGLEVGGEVRAWAADDARIYVSTDASDAIGEFSRSSKWRISAFSRGSGAREWTYEFDSPTDTGVTQLLGHTTWIPILVSRTASGMNFREGAPLSLLLIDKRSGAVTEPRSIGKDFDRRGGSGGATGLLVTPSRIIVQHNGVLAAYGSSAAEAMP